MIQHCCAYRPAPDTNIGQDGKLPASGRPPCLCNRRRSAPRSSPNAGVTPSSCRASATSQAARADMPKHDHPLPAGTSLGGVSEPSDRGTGSQLLLFPEQLPGRNDINSRVRRLNGGKDALLGADVSDYRADRRFLGLWRDRFRRGRNCKDTVFHLPGRLCRDADHRFGGSKKPASLVAPTKARRRPGYPLSRHDQGNEVPAATGGQAVRAKSDSPERSLRLCYCDVCAVTSGPRTSLVTT